MDSLSKSMNELLGKCSKLETFIDLHLRRGSCKTDLDKLKSRSNDAEETIERFTEIVQTELPKLIIEYDEIKNEIKTLQLKMLTMIVKIKMKKKEDEPVNVEMSNKIQNVYLLNNNNNNVIITPQNFRRILNPRSVGTPNVYFSDYEQSPFVSCEPRPQSLQFQDFEANITSKMFQEVPKYMRGRISLDDMHNFLDFIIGCFNEKYKLMKLKRNEIKNGNLITLWKLYKTQESLFPSKKFITQGDLSRKLDKLIDKKTNDKINVLRHLKIIQEQREHSTVFYIWIGN